MFFDQVINGSQIKNRGDTQVNDYRVENLLRHIEVENVTCQDPSWMNTNTFYPEGKKQHPFHLSLHSSFRTKVCDFLPLVLYVL